MKIYFLVLFSASVDVLMTFFTLFMLFKEIKTSINSHIDNLYMHACLYATEEQSNMHEP